MKKELSTNKHGFTIIEVVLVLAIAGLIFLMVFVALPALQRSQRDTQRRNDMSRVASALTNWQTNHNNGLPDSGEAATLISGYLDGANFKDPSGTNYIINISQLSSNGTKSSSSNPTIEIAVNAYCDGETAKYKAGSSNFAILYKLEGSGTVCVDNQ